MNEAQTEFEYIDPALKAAGWGVVEGSQVRKQWPISQGRLLGQGRRSKSLKTDYVLRCKNRSMAVIEAKSQRKAHLLFPEIAIRETIANALIHQDMTISGSGPLIELFNSRLEITNPGKSLVQIDRMIDLPPRSRNEALASLMRRMKMCEEQGTGLDKVIISVEINQLPPPKFQEMDEAMRVILFAPRSFAEMTVIERVRACYQHSIIKYLDGDKMKNSTLCQRFGIEKRNAAQASKVINNALEMKFIKVADPEFPRGGYEPIWA